MPLYEPLFRVLDASGTRYVFTSHPIRFEDLFDRAIECDVGDVSVRVASIPDLIYLKRLADRPRDRDDIEKLEAIARLRSRRDERHDD